MRSIPFLKRCIISTLTLSLTSLSLAATQPVPNPQFGDGRVSDFYLWKGNIPAKPGQLLRTELLSPKSISLPDAGSEYRILYTSTSGIDSKTPTTVSGTIFIPKGTAPAGGWPIVAWGHGTLGLADICTPSWAGRSYRDAAYLNRWLNEGFAVVGTDYEGLGTPGPHLLINNPMLAYNILDSARAALQAKLNLANKVVIVGQSQGGAGAFAASSYSASYAPDVNVKGSIGTGVIYRSREASEAQNNLKFDPYKVDSALAYSIYGFLVAQQYNPALKAEDIFTDKALPLVESARTSCLTNLMGDVQLAGLTYANSIKPNPPESYKQQNVDQANKYGYYLTLKINHPVFIGTGANDVTPDARTQLKLMNDACKAGTTIEGHIYAGLGHSETVLGSQNDSVPFAKKVIAEEKIQAICQPVLQ